MKKIDFHIHSKVSYLDAAFEFCQSKLDEYISDAGLDCIAITNHNLFDKSQFEKIRGHAKIPVLPGIEVDLEKSQILVISDGNDLDDFNDRCAQVAAKGRLFQLVGATLQSFGKDGVLNMKYRRRIYYSSKQRAEIWDRWQRGESMRSIWRVFDRPSSSVFSVISPTGGIRPPDRKRGGRALSFLSARKYRAGSASSVHYA